MEKEYPINRLWGGLPTAKNLRQLSKEKYFFANQDHILIISPNKPKGFLEIDSDFYPLFKADDWDWINNASKSIAEEQRAMYPELAEQELNATLDFVRRFEHELEIQKGSDCA